jgi:TRAP-type C4-dicarboxylate transport system substrate-binding protein
MSADAIRIAGYAPEGSTHTTALRDIARTFGEQTGWAVEVIPNIMDLGHANTDLFDLTESGELTMCYFSSSYLCDRVPELSEIDRPFRFESLAEAHDALDGQLGRHLAEAVGAATGFEVLGFWDNGFRHLTNRLRPVHTPEDVEGMRVRLQPNEEHVALIASWGGIPIPCELSAGIRMIEEGEVDAQENPLANTVAYGVERHHPHVTMTAHLYGARGVFANAATLSAMPTDVVRTLRDAVTAAAASQRRKAAEYEEQLRRDLEAKDLRFVDLSTAERAAFRPWSRPSRPASSGPT